MNLLSDWNLSDFMIVIEPTWNISQGQIIQLTGYIS